MSKYLGIDLGTTNSTTAVVEAAAPETKKIAQLDSPGVVVELTQLPSALYIPAEGEIAADKLKLPWGSPKNIIGTYAKKRAAEVPDRVVLSAKSWLSQPQVERKESILPWGSEIESGKLSPYEVSVLILEHLKHASEGEAEHTIICVPASFDEIARNLTAEAAEKAGFTSFSLLEEPLAALYSWIASSSENWREQLEVGETILVCDLGGGTADFTLVEVQEEDGELRLERLSVGEHILLGGDNMDLALAYQLKAKFEAKGKALDTWQFQSLVQESQRIKERMLSGDDVKLPVTLAGKGSSLFSTTRKAEATREEVLGLIVEGFFPRVSIDEAPSKDDVLGLQEYGLPFEAEPAFTKHLARFLSKNTLPSAVLFNGGVCKSDIIRERVMNVLESWSADVKPRELAGSDYDSAVAKGAAEFAKIKSSGEGLRIRAGVPRSYYLGIETSMPAVPGFKAPVKGVCVVPQGAEEGSEVELEKQTFSLITGREVEFRFFSGNDREADKPGDIVPDAETDLAETSRLRISLPQSEDKASHTIPVRISSKITDIGTLELWMQSRESSDKWKLEFDVRAEKKSVLAAQNSR